MKKSARIALHCLLAMVLTVPLAACGSDTKDTTPKKDMSANTREQLAELAKSDERLNRRTGKQNHQVDVRLGYQLGRYRKDHAYRTGSVPGTVRRTDRMVSDHLWFKI